MNQAGTPLARRLEAWWQPWSPTATPFAIRRWIAVHLLAVILLTVLRINQGLLHTLPDSVNVCLQLLIILMLLLLLVCPVMILAATANRHLGWTSKIMGYLAEAMLWYVHLGVAVSFFQIH